MTSEQRIAEIYEAAFATNDGTRITGAHVRGFMAEAHANALKAVIASVRAEAAEEFCKLFDGYYYGPFEHPSSTIRRALAKERKG